ncbi:MAG: NADP-dependent malic enzyme [Chloroflexi bacterium]|nr:NADP-dependent malic enzyme [Chloroflexota bacterium]MCC6894854.1 NADP-dependent malic enzyme [Anaerolineae bacterium]
MAVTKQDALDYHRNGRPGKIEVVATKPLSTQRDLSLAYTPGVADAVLEIEREPITAYELTAKANLVGVISNGTAILGLGNRGALASKPVMEGKGVLFKRFADIDVFDIELNALTVDEVVNAVRALAPTFGGINLEDIKAPECFEIETRLRAELDIPVFHDDQHGTAIISGAALLNAVEITGRRIEEMRLVVTGAGAAALSTSAFYVQLGMRPENIIMADEHGVIYKGREIAMDPYKVKFANDTDRRTLAEALVGADMFLGLSVAGACKPVMIREMNPNPIIFPMANPTPEIMPEEILAVRPDAIIGTGRSDYPNQINNVLGFPFIFRGALDVYATTINEEMKLAASHALAALAHEDVPDSVLTAYGLTAIKFGKDYLIPKPLDPRVLLWLAPAVAEAAMKSGVARRKIDIEEYRHTLIQRQGVGQQVRANIINKARMGPKQRIVYPEGDDPKIIRAAAQVLEEGIGVPILLGKPDQIRGTIHELGLNFNPQIIEPLSEASRRQRYEQTFHELRQRKGVTRETAARLVGSRMTYGLMMVKMGDADAYVNGRQHEYPDVIRPALQIFHTRPGMKVASGVYIMVVKRRVYFFTDATVNIDPDADTLSEIAILAADFAQTLDIEPRVAMLSFSNFGSSPHRLSEKVRNAVELVRHKRPDLAVDGEMQADTAVIPELIENRFPFSRVKDANVLVFPDLQSANVAYKLLDRLGQAQTIGPILLGMGAPVHVLQAGDDVEDIIAMSAVAAMDAQSRRRY